MGKHACWGLLLAMTVGCDDAPETKPDAAAPSASTAAAPSISAEPPPAPAPPPKTENSVTFESNRISSDGFTLVHTEAAKHEMTTGAQKYVSIIVHLANYDRGGSAYHPNPSKDEHRRVTLNFAAAGDPGVGKYPLDGQLGKSNKLSVGIHSRDHHLGMIGGGTGSGEITSIDGKTVSGKVSVKDEHGTSIEATFSVPYETK